MIHVTLRNGNVLLFNEWERITTVGWISDDGEYWSDERHCRADELEKQIERLGDRVIIEKIDDITDDVFVEKDWLSPVASVRKFVPMAFA